MYLFKKIIDLFNKSEKILSEEEQYLKKIESSIEVSSVFIEWKKLFIILDTCFWKIKCDMYWHSAYSWFKKFDYICDYTYNRWYFDEYLKLSNWKYIALYSADELRINYFWWIDLWEVQEVEWLNKLINVTINEYRSKSDKEGREIIIENINKRNEKNREIFKKIEQDRKNKIKEQLWIN